MKPGICFALVVATIACGGGDNSAVRAFHPTVAVGDSLPELIAEGEKAQAADIRYAVSTSGCSPDDLNIERHSLVPSIRISGPPPDTDMPWDRAYTEFGYANREEFAQGLKLLVPKFYACGEFRFTFGRNQTWPTSDSFVVTVDSNGKVISVSALGEDPDL